MEENKNTELVSLPAEVILSSKESIALSENIAVKFAGFKSWAKGEIEKL